MKRGVGCILLSAFGFALMAMFVRLADGCGGVPLPAIQKAFFRNVIAVAISGWVFFGRPQEVRRNVRLPEGVKGWSDLILRSVLGTGGVFTNFYALSCIGVGDSMALNKTAPFFTLIFSWLLLGERMSPRQMFCVVGAFVGAMLVIKPGCANTLSTPALIGLSSGLCAGAAYAFLHKLGRNGVDGAFIIFFFSAFSCLACLPFIVCWFQPMTWLQVAVLFCAGGAAALGQFGITWAYRFAEPRQLAVYDYTGIIFAALLGFLVFGQVPDALSFLGFATIIGMGLVLHFHPRIAKPALLCVVAVCISAGLRANENDAATGTFEQKKILHDVGVTLSSSGTWSFEKGKRFVWNTVKPVPSVFAATPTNYTFTVGGKTSSHRLAMKVEDIAQIFEIKEMKTLVERVETDRRNPVFESEDGLSLPSSLRVFFKNGDRLEISLKR